MNGINRNLKNKILLLLTQFPVVAILGARQTGKTTLATQITKDWKYIDLENPRDYDRISNDPLFFFEQHPRHVIIDEAQVYPEVFSVLRGVIDNIRNEKGRFILTGSSSPELLDGISETLAGRVAIVELGTLKANEYYHQPLSQFYKLFLEKLSIENVVSGAPPLTNIQMQLLWLKGGYPEPVLYNETGFYEQWMENYRSTYINRDIAKLFPRLNKLAYRRFLALLSKLSGTILNKRDIARALEVSEGTVREYITIAEGTFLWRSLPSFEKNIVKSVIKMPKGYICDTGLLHNILQISTLEELYDNILVGNSFEAFVIEEIVKGLQATMVTNWQVYYYRTRNGSEIDLLLDGPFGLLPVEIKYGSTIKLKQLTALTQFMKEHELSLGMVINQSDAIEWLAPNIVQVPLGWL